MSFFISTINFKMYFLYVQDLLFPFEGLLVVCVLLVYLTLKKTVNTSNLGIKNSTSFCLFL
ncbi:hypothetical protein IX38_05925 [Chryseobacterium luteum]|uniref:Uncharacterized protein n=1 Tax=Chryseobacterium luteum TaxID=421531 RepID=A0A085ZV39_9FLAO|nr:hypothetical protein IX38_05925 [Chryseobacterium luteum]